MVFPCGYNFPELLPFIKGSGGYCLCSAGLSSPYEGVYAMVLKAHQASSRGSIEGKVVFTPTWPQNLRLLRVVRVALESHHPMCLQRRRDSDLLLEQSLPELS